MSSKRWRSKYDEIQEAGYGSGRRSMKVERLTNEELKLLQAVRLQQTKRFKQLLDTGVNPNIRDDMGSTPLHYAAQDKSQSEFLVTLLHCGADPNATDRWGKTALHYAVEGCMDNARSLLDAGAHIDAQDIAGTTPLMTVALQGGRDDAKNVVQLLADHGCNVHLRCSEGCTALHMVCLNTYMTTDMRCCIARMLLGLGLSATAENKEGDQALCIEISRVNTFGQFWVQEDLTVMKVLIQAGSYINLKKKHHQKTIMHCLNFMEANFNWQMLQLIAPALPLSKLQCLQGFFSRASNTLGYSEHMVRYVKERSRTPISLRAGCRLALRELFRGKVFYRVQTLSVPESVKKYICDLEDDFVFEPSEEKKD